VDRDIRANSTQTPAPERRVGGGSATATLLRRYHEQGDTHARQRLIELYLPLVESFARRYARGSDDYDDLYQVGCIGLINAIDRFDLMRGDELAAFAVPNIGGEIRRYLRDLAGDVRLPRRVLELRPSAVRLQAELSAKLGRAPTTAELAGELGVDESDVELALSAENTAVTLERSPEPDASQGDLDRVDDRLFLLDATRGLDDRERRILYLRYVRDLAPNDVARELGISRRQLSRNTQAALSKLRLGLEHGALSEVTPGPEPAQRRLPRLATEPKMAPVATGQSEREHQLDQAYHIELIKDGPPKGGWTAQVEELAGCSAHGSTPDEAVRRVEGAMRQWIAEARAKHREVPRPHSASSHSGRLLVRMPQSLHADLARAAGREEVSLNQFITSSLASAIGWRRGGNPGNEAGADSTSASSRPVGTRVAIVANIVVLAIVAVVALVLLIIALERGV
jgi:RNA polymerase sigma-B factor